MQKLIFLLILGSLLSTPMARAEEKKEVKEVAPDFSWKGLFYDKERDKYFSNDKSIFSIRPISKTEYLDRIEVSIDGGEFSNYKGVLKFEKEGPHQVRFRAVDPVLNWSPVQTFRIFVDKTSPKSQVVWKGPTFYEGDKLFINAQTSLNMVAQDNLSGVAEIFWVSNGKTIRYQEKNNFLSLGAQTIQIYSIDNVGNKEEPHSLSFIVDGTGPTSTMTIQGTHFKNQEDSYITTDSKITLSSKDDLSGTERIEFQLDEGPITTYTRPIVISGTKTQLRFRAVDKVGNKENWKSVPLTQDVTAPRIRITQKGESFTIGGKIYARPGLLFSLNVTDQGSGIKEKMISMDGGKNYKKLAEDSIQFDKAGEHHFHLKAVDHMGNTEESNPYTIVIDNTAPVVAHKSTELIHNKGDYYLSSVPNRIFFEADDDGVGTDRIEISYNNKDFENFNSPIDVSKWKNSERDIYYRAVDRLGNTSETEKIRIKVITRGPKVELFVESEKLPNVPLSKIKEEYEKK